MQGAGSQRISRVPAPQSSHEALTHVHEAGGRRTRSLGRWARLIASIPSSGCKCRRRLPTASNRAAIGETLITKKNPSNLKDATYPKKNFGGKRRPPPRRNPTT